MAHSTAVVPRTVHWMYWVWATSVSYIRPRTTRVLRSHSKVRKDKSKAGNGWNTKACDSCAAKLAFSIHPKPRRSGLLLRNPTAWMGSMACRAKPHRNRSGSGQRDCTGLRYLTRMSEYSYEYYL